MVGKKYNLNMIKKGYNVKNKTPWNNNKKNFDRGGIRTHASEETGALNQRLRPLGHAIEEFTWF